MCDAGGHGLLRASAGRKPRLLAPSLLTVSDDLRFHPIPQVFSPSPRPTTVLDCEPSTNPAAPNCQLQDATQTLWATLQPLEHVPNSQSNHEPPRTRNAARPVPGLAVVVLAPVPDPPRNWPMHKLRRQGKLDHFSLPREGVTAIRCTGKISHAIRHSCTAQTPRLYDNMCVFNDLQLSQLHVHWHRKSMEPGCH